MLRDPDAAGGRRPHSPSLPACCPGRSARRHRPFGAEGCGRAVVAINTVDIRRAGRERNSAPSAGLAHLSFTARAMTDVLHMAVSVYSHLCATERSNLRGAGEAVHVQLHAGGRSCAETRLAQAREQCCSNDSVGGGEARISRRPLYNRLDFWSVLL
jgi:hypothetical protein